jgi:hypothetical protein
VRRAIAREPGDRYGTAGELARAVTPFVTEAVVAPHDGPPEHVSVVRPEPENATGVDATLPGIAPGSGTGGRTTTRAVAFGVIALVLAGIWWARQPRRSLPVPPPRVVATAAPVAVAPVEQPSARVVEATPAVAATASVVATVTVAAPTAEVAPAYRDARATLADPQEAEAGKLAVIETLASDRSAAATDLLVDSTRNPSILVSMAAVKALAGRACGRVAGPLATLLDDQEWQRRAWAAKILGANGCLGARDALAMRRGREKDARVTKIVDDAITMLDEKGNDR